LGVLLLAIGLRIAGLLSIAGTPRSRWPQVDAWTYFDQAKKLAEGASAFDEGFYQPPGYPAFLSLVFRLFGATPDVARATNAVLGVLTVLGLLYIGRHLGRRLDAPWVGPIAAALYTLYPRTILLELDLLTPPLTNALVVGAIALLFVQRFPLWVRAIGVGLLCAWAAEVHAAALLLIPVLGATLWRMGGRFPKAGLAFCAALLIGVWPTWGRNLQQWDSWAPISHNSGLNFFLGNNPSWKETMFLRAGLPFRDLVLDADPHRRNLPQRNAYWTDRAQAEIAKDPLGWFGALAEKAYWSVHHREIPRNEDYGCWTEQGRLQWIGALPIRYGLLLPFALLGAVALVRRERQLAQTKVPGPSGAVAIPLTWLALHLPMVLFFVSDRYRLATWPWLCICAALAPVAWRHWQTGPRNWGLVAVALTASLLPWGPIDTVTDPDPGWCRHLEGNYAISDRDWVGAEALYREAIALNPDDIGAYPWLSAALDRQGRLDEAIEAGTVALEAFPASYPTLKTMAGLARKSGDLDRAIEYTARAMQVPGDRSTMATRYVSLLVEAKRYTAAEAFLKKYPKLRKHPRLQNAINTLQKIRD
jgi:tetratricopeptide (TPR) repeat protein